MSDVRLPVILISRPSAPSHVLVGSDEATCLLVIERGVDPSGLLDLAHYSDGYGHPDGRRFRLWYADLISAPVHAALVVRNSGRVVVIYLVTDQESAAVLAECFDEGAVDLDIVPATVLDERVLIPELIARTEENNEALSRALVMSEEFCPRCSDHLLHLDPRFDAAARSDGSRICNPCGRLEALRAF